MFRFISLILILLLACKAEIQDETFFHGSWALLNTTEDSGQYQELYFNEESIYIFMDGFLSGVVQYKLKNDSITYVFQEKENNFSLHFEKVNDISFKVFGGDSINTVDVTYIRLFDGVTPEDYVMHDRESDYSDDFQSRKEDYLKSKE